jgi:hypothetical protein
MGRIPIILRHVAFKPVMYVQYSTLDCKGVKRINLHSSDFRFEEVFEIARQFSLKWFANG